MEENGKYWLAFGGLGDSGDVGIPSLNVNPPDNAGERSLPLCFLTPLPELSSCSDYPFAPAVKVSISSDRCRKGLH